MADGWLPEGFENQDVAAPGRVAGRVALRIERRRRGVKILQGGLALTAFAILVGSAPSLWNKIRPVHQAPAQQQVAQLKVERPGWTPERDGEGATSVGAASVGATFRSRSLSPDSNPSPPEGGSHNTDEAAPTVTMVKEDHRVCLTWQGSNTQEYEVYRCSSPRFDTCSLAGVVKGTRWSDGAQVAPGSVVFYKVEAKAGA